ncbi:MAG: hypothetical protein IKB80_03775 [Oscillospiraceae bacterium]|nr:hypothetical protein [Oscillospiraceae bacterium]
MFSDVFLAQTREETTRSPAAKTAYMACRFSPYGKGLSNLPQALPAGSILLLDDSMSPNGHDPQVVETELRQTIDRLDIAAVLLDFQGQMQQETMDMARHLVNALPSSVAVTEAYAKVLRCPVFLSPTPVNAILNDYIEPWLQQGVYLEIAPMTTCFTVTEQGCASLPIPFEGELPLYDERLRSHYKVEVFPDRAVFTLCRTGEDLAALAQDARQLGILGAVGLYQELSQL